MCLQAIKGPEEQIDLFAFEGLKLSANAKMDRKVLHVNSSLKALYGCG